MKIKNIRNAKKGLAFIIAVELLAMQYYVPPFRREESFELEQQLSEENNGVSRKLSKRKNKLNLKSKRYTFEG